MDDLPDHIHRSVLTERSDVMEIGEQNWVVLWADRPTWQCPRCFHPIHQVTGCPVAFDPGATLREATLEEVPKDHGCGEWIGVNWRAVDPQDYADGGAGAERDAIAELLAQRENAVEQARAQARGALRRDLQEFFADADADATGSVIEPGIYYEDGLGWIAWDWDPAVEGPTATIAVDSAGERQDRA